jgi:4-hydroxybenzoate polyprenyltransferase
MALKIFAGLVGVVLLLIYVAPVVLKLKDIPLWCVALLGIGMMLVDLWQSLQSKED